MALSALSSTKETHTVQQRKPSSQRKPASKPANFPTPPNLGTGGGITKLFEQLATLSKEDQEKLITEKLEENLPSDEFIQKMASTLAKTRYAMYKAHIDAGFTEAQALLLCQSK